MADIEPENQVSNSFPDGDYPASVELPDGHKLYVWEFPVGPCSFPVSKRTKLMKSKKSGLKAMMEAREKGKGKDKPMMNHKPMGKGHRGKDERMA